MKYEINSSIATRWSIGQQRHFIIYQRNLTYMYVSFIVAYIVAVLSNTTWWRVIVPYGAVPYRYRTIAVLPVWYGTVRYGTVPYGTGTVPYNRRFARVVRYRTVWCRTVWYMYRTVRYRYHTVRYGTVPVPYRYGGIQYWIYTVTRPL